MNHPELQHKAFLLLLISITLAFAWVLAPFSGAIFWSIILAIIFFPLHQRLLVFLRMRENLAAGITLLLCLIIVVFPVTLIATSLVHQGSNVYQSILTGELNFGEYFKQVISVLPVWLANMLDRFGLGDFSGLQAKLSASSLQGSQFIATKAFNLGQNTFNFIFSVGIMLYLLFFLIRDGAKISTRIKHALPLHAQTKQYLFVKFNTVIRATVKGNIVVAAVQGSLGGLLFWFLGIQAALLWGVLMAVLSLLPALGAALIWAPVAIYFLVTGAIGKGLTMIAFGMLVIGLVDNILRPILVGKDARLPDYVVLVSTVGGLALFGLHGFVMGPVIAALFIATWDIFTSSTEAPGN